MSQTREESGSLNRLLVGIIEEVLSSNLFFNAKIPFLCGMLRYRPNLSAVASKEP